MKRRLFDLLACPICGDSFSLRVLKEEDAPSFQPSSIPCQDRCLWKEERGFSGITVEDCARCYGKEILEGIVICPDGHEFAVSGGILRTLGKREKREPGGGEEFFHSLKRHGGVKATFDREWRMVDAGQEIYGHSPEAEEEDFFRRLCVKENFLRGKLLLDVGSGIGRLADRLTRKAAEVVGVELSDGVDRAWERLHTNPRVHFIQGNLFTLPLRPRTFDYVYSKGVFQYVSNPREAFRRVARSVRPGGGFSITLYPPLPPFFFILNRSIRALTLR
ncbi:MAG: Phthiotriol/phenolphthiotriol dimycocerosates methyltransferase, partial [Deltaproteobacteria bacterium]|nr:Phthiotriol/phenolphthiotriol dimycocerosates methyltransferase [Deltaproteobacteria bacterium]